MNHQYWKNDKNILILTTTRDGGFSKKPFDSFNLALHVGDKEENVIKNRELLSQDLGISQESFVYAYQSHGTTITKVTSNDKGRGIKKYEDGIAADAIYTTEKGIALAIFHADCVPLMIYVKNKPLVMVVHAGQKGSIDEIAYKAITTIVNDEKVNPRDIKVIIGPAKQFINNSVDEETINKVAHMGYHLATKCSCGIFYLDLPLLNYLQLIKAGVPPKNITLSSICTYENCHQFFSYKKKEETGRNISLVYLR